MSRSGFKQLLTVALPFMCNLARAWIVVEEANVAACIADNEYFDTTVLECQ